MRAPPHAAAWAVGAAFGSLGTLPCALFVLWLSSPPVWSSAATHQTRKREFGRLTTATRAPTGRPPILKSRHHRQPLQIPRPFHQPPPPTAMAEQPPLVTLNVGGRLFTVLRATLRSRPGSLLSALFSGEWEPTAVRDEHGHPFIDR